MSQLGRHPGSGGSTGGGPGSRVSLRQRLVFVRSVFFPAWDRSRHWHVTTRSRSRWTEHADGECCSLQRTIRIHREYVQAGDFDELDAVLIHEVVHATVGRGHGVRFRRRLHRAAVVAERVGRQALADALKVEVASLEDAIMVRAPEIYAAIRDAALDGLSWSAALREICLDYVQSAAEMRRRYPRIHHVHQNVVQARERERAREGARSARLRATLEKWYGPDPTRTTCRRDDAGLRPQEPAEDEVPF